MWIIELTGNLLVYIVAIIIAVRLNKQHASWWKIFIVFFIGLFSFSIHFEFFGQMHQFALLPLGVFLLFLFTLKNRERWYKYRPFAWLGFAANFGFFVVSILTVPIINAIYPPNDIDTYIQSLDEAKVLHTHISKTGPVQLVEHAQTLLQQSSQGEVQWHEWYHLHTDSIYDYSYETFPYMLTDVTHPFGMDKPVHFFVEQNGKGLLIITDDVQYYFQTNEPILDYGGEADA